MVILSNVVTWKEIYEGGQGEMVVRNMLKVLVLEKENKKVSTSKPGLAWAMLLSWFMFVCIDDLMTFYPVSLKAIMLNGRRRY